MPRRQQNLIIAWIVGDYTIRVMFDDASEQVIDFEPILYGPMFEPLRELEVFNQVKLDSNLGTLVWPTGADIDPNVLHDWPTMLRLLSSGAKKIHRHNAALKLPRQRIAHAAAPGYIIEPGAAAFCP